MAAAVPVGAHAQTKTYQAPSTYTTDTVISSNPKGGNLPKLTTYSYSVASGSTGWTDWKTVPHGVADAYKPDSCGNNGFCSVNIFNGTYTDPNGVSRMGHKFTLRPGQTPEWNSPPRAEFASATGAVQNRADGYPDPRGWAAGVLKEGTEIFFKWSMYIPSSFSNAQRWAVLWQLHPGNKNWLDVPANKWPNPTFPGLQVKHNESTGAASIGFGLGPEADSSGNWSAPLNSYKGRWVDYAARFKFSTGSDGLIEFYVDGNLVHTKTGNNMPYVNSNNTPWYYLKYGYYRKASIATEDTVYITPVLYSLPQAAAPDFTVATSPQSLTVNSGGSGSVSVSVSALSGFNSSVSLSAHGLPTNASYSFSPSSVVGSGSSTLTLNAGSAVAGTYEIEVRGTSGSIVRTANVKWTINAGTAPSIALVKTIFRTPKSLTIDWKTDTEADSQVEYGPTTSYGSATPVDSAWVVAHRQTLIDLAPNSRYHLRVKSTNGNGTSYSPDYEIDTTQPTWTRQSGGPEDDYAYGATTDADGNAIVVGYTKGELYGQHHFGGRDAFIAKFDPYGYLIWATQFGGSGDDHAYGVAMSADGTGNVYVAGSTTAAFSGITYNGGAHDAFLAKFDANGNQLWVIGIGTAGDDIGYAVASDSLGHAFVAGSTDGSLFYTNSGGIDAWVARYAPAAGAYSWGRQLGSTGDQIARGVAMDNTAGHLYVVGDTTTSLFDAYQGGAHDAFVADYVYSTGNRNWVKSFGSAGDDVAYAAATDSSSRCILTGSTTGALSGSNAGGLDAFVAQYSTGGTQQWKAQFGTTGDEAAYAAVTDPSNNIYVSGSTTGSLAYPNSGGTDVFVAKYSSAGSQVYKRQTGTDADEVARGIAYGRPVGETFSDDFNRTSGLGSSWTVSSGSWSTNGSAARATGGSQGYAFWTGTADANAAPRVSLVTPLPSTYVGVITRANTAAPDSDHYAAYVGPDGLLHIARRNAWTYTYLADSTSPFPTSGTHTLSITATGTNPVVVTVRVDNTVWLTYSDSSASRLSSAGKVGMFDFNGAGALIDAFTVFQPTPTIFAVGGTNGEMGSAVQGDKDVFVTRHEP